MAAALRSAMELTINSTIKLPNGNLPRLGFGVYQSREKACWEAVRAALKAGYRHIDTAQAYRNEDAVGTAVAYGGVSRDKVFITTKYMPTHTPKSSDEVYETIRKSLHPLNEPIRYTGNNPYVRQDPVPEGEGWIDLMLIHAGFGGPEGRAANWEALARAQKEGWVRDIGVSNFSIFHLMNLPEPKPAVNQLEIHPWCQQREIVKYCEENGIAVQAYSPLIRGDPKRLGDKTLSTIALNKGKSSGQILLRWSLQKGYCPLPKSVTPHRIVQNADVFSFELDEREMALLDALDEGDEGACTWNPVDVA